MVDALFLFQGGSHSRTGSGRGKQTADPALLLHMSVLGECILLSPLVGFLTFSVGDWDEKVYHGALQF